MIWTLILIGIVIIGIICIIVGNYYSSEGLFLSGLFTTIVSILILVTFIGMIIGANATANIDYQNKLHERDMLEYRIEHMEENITGNEMLYNDIVEFNNNLRTTKKWANSPWTNWFNNQKIASMDYIELEN